MKKIVNVQILTTLAVVILMLLGGCKKNADENNPLPSSGTVKDIDGNVYHTVTIGTQVWMVENLKTTKYRNGDPIPNVTGDITWDTVYSGAYCNYENNESNVATYGRMYNWYAVIDSRNICPTGWHIPTDAEWSTLTNFLGGEGVAGGKMKEAGNTHWQSPNTDANNSSGFTALPGGYRGHYGDFGYLGVTAFFWSSTPIDGSYLAWEIALVNDFGSVIRIKEIQAYGTTVRCLKD